uniref:Zinc finger B-box domain containing n=1 Tax=Loxodonta africana TaxID=9785 RepID=G3SUQ6_LOXAF
QAKSQILSSVLDVAHQFIREVHPDEPKGESRSTKEISKSPHKSKSLLLQGSCSEVEITTSKRAESTNQKDELLCEGSFDEEASARFFQEVLNQWRTRNHDDNEKQNLHAEKPGSMEACEVQTNLKIWSEPLEIEFKEDSLSYMEKLWLKKHRRTLQDHLLNMQPNKFILSCKTTRETQFSPDGSEEESDVEETKVQCPELFLPIEELKIERPEPSLKIVELDDTYEEEFEEPGNVVPYKVELPDADSKQRHESWTFHDYQKNNLPCENDIHQHYVFTKGKIDLLKFCLTSSTSYYKDNSKGEKLSQDIKESLDFSNLHERPNLQDSKTTKSAQLLQEIALRSKPITDRYQGLERFFICDKNERPNLCPSRSLERSSSSTRSTLAGDREWIPDHSLSAYADNVAALDVLLSAQNPWPSRTEERTGK